MATTQVFSAVLRRYSDFLWLYEKLQTERSGAIVPPLPEKQPVGRFNPKFVEHRRRDLERFLRRAAVHPELQGCASLDAFLQADDVTFQAAKNSKTSGNGMVMQQSGMMAMANSMMMPPQPTMGSPTKKDGFKRWFAETKTSISGDLVSTKYQGRNTTRTVLMTYSSILPVPNSHFFFFKNAVLVLTHAYTNTLTNTCNRIQTMISNR